MSEAADLAKRWGIRSIAMRHALELTQLYSRYDRSVVFVGPVGSGKTTLARTVYRSERFPGRFVAIGSGELGDTLYADTLFGHTAGAFTGADSTSNGALMDAANGVLLLDDLALMSKAAQAAILTVIETGRYRRLGSMRKHQATCRILFASTMAPEELVSDGRMLLDLASRLGEFIVNVPPLSQRREDIVPIANEVASDFLREHRVRARVKLDEEAIRLLESYNWPGNVRELRSVVERAVVHAGSSEGTAYIKPSHIPGRIRTFDGSTSTQDQCELSLALIERAVKEADGNQSEAARMLGVHRNTIGRYLRSAG